VLERLRATTGDQDEFQSEMRRYLGGNAL
jgi:hypothetical protein